MWVQVPPSAQPMINLRKFSLPDLERILEVEKVSFLNREAWSGDYFEKLQREYPEGFIIAESDDEIVGYTIGRPKNNSAEIISLAVAPSWRKKGVGITLTNFLTNHFKEKRLKEIFLCVRIKNQEGISFYQNLDFKTLKTIKNYYRNGDDAFLMKKEI